MEIRGIYKTIEDDIADAAHDLGVLLGQVVYGKINERDVMVAGVLYHMFGFDDDWVAMIAGTGVGASVESVSESVQELAREELARQLVAGKWRLVEETTKGTKENTQGGIE